MSHRDDDLQRIYDGLPTIECQRLCQASCGPIGMGPEEFMRICDRRGSAPPYVISDAGSGRVLLAPPPPDLTCPLLGPSGGCSVYRYRPLLCRLYGVAEGMECPHGCKPKPRYLTRAEAYRLLDAVGATGDPSLSTALARATQRR